MNLILNKLLKELTNIIESPFLIWEILTMLRVGIKGESGRQLDNFLQLIATEIGVSEKDLEHLTKKYVLSAETDFSPTKALAAHSIDRTPAYSNTKLLWIANRIFIKSGARLNTDFTNILKQKFSCGVQEIDFSAPALAAQAINDWVKIATNERIPTIIGSNDVGPDTQTVLANAIYFKAQWRQQFEPADTKVKPFFINETQNVPVSIMSQVLSARYAYLPDHKAKVIELPYRDTDLAMLVILPTEVDTDLSGLANLRLPAIVEKLVFRKVCVKLPKFTIGCTINVHSLLAEFGVRGIFHGSADFSGLIQNNPSSFGVSKIIQQAFIKVSEEGTEAAAATSCCIDGAMRYEESFVADHAFYFCIKNRDCLKLFEGCYRQP